MGSHRLTGPGAARRGVAPWAVASIAVLAVAIAGIIVWARLGGTVDAEGKNAAQQCVSGDVTIKVTGPSEVGKPLEDAVQAFTATHPIAQDHCINIDVDSVPSDAAYRALVSGDHSINVWIPASSIWIARLKAAAPDALNGEPLPLATSPLVVAIDKSIPPGNLARLNWSQITHSRTVQLVGATSSTARELAAQSAIAVNSRTNPITVSAVNKFKQRAAPYAGVPITVTPHLTTNPQRITATITSQAKLTTLPKAQSVELTGKSAYFDYSAVDLTTADADPVKAQAASQFLQFLREHTDVFTSHGFAPPGDIGLEPCSADAAEAVATILK